ncbi:MAG: aminotransferase class V-fold PLP-dependent enzyme [Thermomicrobiaceae bacterium]
MAATDQSSKVDAIRNEMPYAKNNAFLNAGSFGPIPQRTMDAIREYMQLEFEEGRSFQREAEIKMKAREAAAAAFSTPVKTVALTRHTTDGMNIGIMGLNWEPGDELIITDTEHPGGQYPSYVVARRYGVQVRRVNLGDGTGDVVGAVEAAITPKTRMIVTSHLTWNTGTVLPVKEIQELANRHNLLLVCDAAQSAGSIPANLGELEIDVYATPGQKWLCGPEGTGATFISERGIERLNQTVVGGGSMQYGANEHLGGYFLPHPGANRFEVAGAFQPAIIGYTSSVSWISQELGMQWVHQRIAELGKYAWDKLSKLDGVNVLTPKDRMAGLVSFTVDGVEPPALVERLAKDRVIVRNIGFPVCSRLSASFYNTEEDIDKAAASIEAARRELAG